MTRDEKEEYLCHTISKTLNNIGLCEICSTLGGCKIKQKSDQQLDYILSDIKSNIYLEACPGSGKTEVIGLKAAYEFSKWKSATSGIAILTFTNNATDVIQERVSQFTPNKMSTFPHYIGTIDSWLHGYVAQPFLHNITEYEGKDNDFSYKVISEEESPSRNSKQFLYAYQSKTPFVAKRGGNLVMLPIYANNIRLNDPVRFCVPAMKSKLFVSAPEYFSSVAFTEYREKKNTDGNDKKWIKERNVISAFEEVKKKFNKSGYVTYHDVERLSISFLVANPEVSKRLGQRFPVIFVDECQDLSPEQLTLLKILKTNGSNLHFVGDVQQSIYKFKDVLPENIELFVNDNMFSILNMSSNYRSCQEIINTFSEMVPLNNSIVSMHKTKLEFPCVCLIYDKANVGKLSNWYSDYLVGNGVSEEKSVILARGWSTVRKLRPAKHGDMRPQLLFASSLVLWTKSGKQYKSDALESVSKFISSTLFSMEPISAADYNRPTDIFTSSDWRVFLAYFLSLCIKSIPINNLKWSKWAARVRGAFPELLSKSFDHIGITYETPILDANGKYPFRVPNGLGEVLVSSTVDVSDLTNPTIPVTTIHNVKGQTFDAVMLVSNLDKKGTTDGHWEQWTADKESEAARLGYVASSRPRDLLVWAVTTLNTTNKTKLQKMGFSIVEMDKG